MEAPRTAIRVTTAIATPHRLLSFRYSERHRAPRVCGHCGALLLIGDVPTASYPRVDVVCLLCSQESHELTYDGLRAPMTPEQFRALPTQRPRGAPHPGGTSARRLVGLLVGRDRPMPSGALAEALGISIEATRNAVAAARYAGHDVVWTRLGYVLERGQ